MELKEAVKVAMKAGKGVRREAMGVLLLPTNTRECFLIMEGGKLLSGKWNPSLDDILADDWHVAGF